MLDIFLKDAKKPTGLFDNPSLRYPMRDPKSFQKEIAVKIANKILRDEGIKALERERKARETQKKEREKKKSRKKLRKELRKESDKRYVKKEESDRWWKKKLKLLAVIGALFLGWVTSPEKLDTEKWIEMIFEILRN